MSRTGIFKINDYDKSSQSYNFPKILPKSKRFTRNGKCRTKHRKLEGVNIMSSNCRSVNCKRKSIESILKEKDIDICILSEMNTKNPPIFKGYMKPFNKLSTRAFHGLSIYVRNNLKGHVLRVPDEDPDLEMDHLIIKNTVPHIHLFGVYLDGEAKLSNEKTEKIWSRLRSLIENAIENQEGIILMGDLNRPISNAQSKMQYGTQLLEDWLKEGLVQLLNDRSIPTRYDPKPPHKGSVLDLGIVSKNMISFVTRFEVDSKREWTPFYFKGAKGSKIKQPSDHCSILLTINVPATHQNSSKTPIINFNNKEGWKNYYKISNKYAKRIQNLVENICDMNELRRKIYILNLEILVKSFGITWEGPGSKKKKRKDSKIEKELINEQNLELDKMLSGAYSARGLDAKVYKLKQLIQGPKIKAPEPMCINDPETGNLVTDVEEIKTVSLKHSVKILSKNQKRKEDEEEHRKIEEHHIRIMNSKDDDWHLDRELFNKVLERIKSKKKKMFDPLNKSGELYKEAIYKYMEKIIKSEHIPDDFKNTRLTQIWKKKGSALDLNNMRFIHMRSWEAKLCEALVTEQMKKAIVTACPNIQIGGMPGSSSTEHLLTLKTWMLMKETFKQDGIFQVFDMAKFFDKESLLDVMYTLSTKAKISNKSYRLWHQLNEDTKISVLTSVGETNSEIVKNSIGQGGMAAALASSLNIGCAIEETFKSNHSSSIGEVRLNSLILQDDISRVNDTLKDARKGCKMLDNTLKRKLLSVNYDKSKFLVIGSKKYRNKILQDIDKAPMKMGGVVIDHSEKEKYLGDIIHEKGCRESISATIKMRMSSLISKCDEIIQLSESPYMGGTGNSLPAIKLFEAQIIPALLYNCESWIGISDNQVAELQIFQDKFLRKLFRLPISTAKAILHWDTGLKPMKWRIVERKMLFLAKIMAKNHNNIAKKVLLEEWHLGLKGLGYECREASKLVGIPNLMCHQVSKTEIKGAIREQYCLELKEAMRDSKKVSDRLTDNPADNTYVTCLPLHQSRIWLRYRARAINGVKMNSKNSHNNLSCRFCNSSLQESQEHLEECEGTNHERRGLDMGTWNGLLVFWKRMTAKMEAAVT